MKTIVNSPDVIRFSSSLSGKRSQNYNVFNYFIRTHEHTMLEIMKNLKFRFCEAINKVIVSLLFFLLFNTLYSQCTSCVPGGSFNFSSNATISSSVCYTSVSMNNNILVTIQSGVTLTICGDLSGQNGDGITVNSGGSLIVTGSLNVSNTFSLISNGSVSVGSISVNNSSSLTVQGTGSFSVTNSVTMGNSGAITVSSGGNFQVGGNLTVGSSSSITVSGTLGVIGTITGAQPSGSAVLYRSATTGNWGANSAWEYSTNGTNWSTAIGTPKPVDGSITILNGHNVTVSESVSVDQITVNSGGTLTVNPTYTLTVNNGSGNDITLDGTMIVNGTVSNSGAIQVNTGGYYKHANGSILPTGIAFGTSGSAGTLEVSGSATCSNVVSLATTSELFNLIWSSSGAMPTGASGGSDIKTLTNGYFTMSSGSFLAVSSGSTNLSGITIGGIFTLSGGTVTIIQTTGSGGKGQIAVSGDFLFSSGTLNTASAAAASIGDLRVAGNFTHTGGTLRNQGTTSSTIYLNGTSGIQNIESIGQSGAVYFDVATSNAQCRVAAGKTFVYSLGTRFNIGAGTANPDLLIDGTLNRLSSAAITGSSITISVSSGGLYISNYNSASLPTATWNANATLQIDASIADGEFTESFGNVLFNNAAGCTMYTSSSAFTQTIKGDLIINSTGNIYVHNAGSQEVTLTVNGNFLMSGNGVFDLDNVLNAGSITRKLIVNGDFSQSNGTFKLSSNTSNTMTNRRVLVDVYGSFSHTGGTISESVTAAPPAMNTRINLLGTTSETFESTGQTGQIEIVCNKTGAAGIGDFVSLSASSQIDYNLTLTSGKLIVSGGKTLFVGNASANGTITGGSSSSYIVAYDNGTTIGKLQRAINTAASTTYVFPIGDLSNYAPVSYTLVSGTLSSANLSVYTKPVRISAMNISLQTYLNRYWEVTPTGISASNYSISYNYATADINSMGNESNLLPVKLSGGVWYRPIGSAFQTGLTEGTGTVDIANNLLTWTGLTTYSGFSGAGNQAVNLPVELVVFTGACVDRKNLLKWESFTEMNNDYYTIENTIDGISFEEIGKVDGAGNASEINAYEFVHENYRNVINYYRLKQTDIDGLSQYSKLISIDNRLEVLEKEIVSITNLLGQDINENYKGLVIVTFSDGSSLKRIQ